MVTVTVSWAIYSKSRKKFKGETRTSWTDTPQKTYRTEAHAKVAVTHLTGNHGWTTNPTEIERIEKALNDLIIMEVATHWEVP